MNVDIGAVDIRLDIPIANLRSRDDGINYWLQLRLDPSANDRISNRSKGANFVKRVPTPKLAFKTKRNKIYPAIINICDNKPKLNF